MVVGFLRTHTSKWCYMMCVANAMVNSNLLSLVYPCALFLV
jgi:hypothetical protein